MLALVLWSGLVAADSASVSAGVRANLRDGKAGSYRVIRVLAPLTSVEVLQVEQDYVKVRTSQEETGWLPKRLLTIHEDSASTAPDPNAVTAAQQELEAAEARLSRLQNELEQARNEARAKVFMAMLVGAIALLFGIMLGVFLHEIYYRKRLNGLRI